MNNFISKLFTKSEEKSSKQKIENIVFLIVILIITVIVMNKIWNDENNSNNNETNEEAIDDKILADTNENSVNNGTDEEEKLENILKTIKGVGNVKVYISYSESKSTVPLYNETTTTSDTEEDDSEGGTRNVTSTETQKEVVLAENSGEKTPITQKTTEPVIKGAIITAEGAGNATIKTSIVNAIEAATGLSAEKIQVFEMN